MPELSGLQLVEALDHPSPPAVIFVTAYDSFAVEAFREGAVDYLLKPLDEERLKLAIERAQQALETRDAKERIAELEKHCRHYNLRRLRAKSLPMRNISG